jgi:hypothetical protein
MSRVSRRNFLGAMAGGSAVTVAAAEATAEPSDGQKLEKTEAKTFEQLMAQVYVQQILHERVGERITEADMEPGLLVYWHDDGKIKRGMVSGYYPRGKVHVKVVSSEGLYVWVDRVEDLHRL